jgi:hypothetical protein
MEGDTQTKQDLIRQPINKSRTLQTKARASNIENLILLDIDMEKQKDPDYSLHHTKHRQVKELSIGDNLFSTTNGLLSVPQTQKKVNQSYFYFCLFGKLGHIGTTQFLYFLPIHDFLYNISCSCFYVYIFYMMSKGPLKLLGYISLQLGFVVFGFALLALFFRLRQQREMRHSSCLYLLYYYSRFFTNYVSLLMDLYFIFGYMLRFSMEQSFVNGIIELGEQRFEMQGFEKIRLQCFVVITLLLINMFHLLQNLFWQRKLNEYWADFKSKQDKLNLQGLVE